ncbi:hypothetical protein CXF85_04930 [Colwellia sp. 75C3]|uniref:hypothetical protein n=1 Tax=Colwellia sp. 75C3 TaxID=888425 RepID=UPI000C32B7CD|nr:hypothetical protein [Colwellia sp. 75C3]PKG84957.1 hypothetical protein CXF85_04930 [Colwellia sp. 75C3]
MLKGRYTAIVISVLLHLLILFALTYSAIKQPKIIKKDKPKITSIKSFLYSAPKKRPNTEITAKKNINEQKSLLKVEPKKSTPKKPVHTEALTVAATIPVNNLPKNTQNKAVINTLPKQVTNAVKSDTVTTKNKVAGARFGNFSSYDRLSRLRQKLDNQQSEQAFAEFTQKRSASVMDGEPFPVPKTIVPLTVEQQHKLTTSTSHTGSITKNDDGTCTINRAQIYGSPIPATTSYFACGESKFDKNFREHMKKVQAKLKTKGR